MRHPRKHKGDGTANGFFAIGDHAFDRHLQLVQLSFDFFEESRQVSLLVLLSKGRANRISSERQSRTTTSALRGPHPVASQEAAKMTRPCFCKRALIRS